jgi:hypothetical protein
MEALHSMESSSTQSCSKHVQINEFVGVSAVAAGQRMFFIFIRSKYICWTLYGGVAANLCRRCRTSAELHIMLRAHFAGAHDIHAAGNQSGRHIMIDAGGFDGRSHAPHARHALFEWGHCRGTVPLFFWALTF